MKKTVFLIASLLLLSFLSLPALAAPAETATEQGNFEVDGALVFASGPDSFDSGFGLNFGAGYMLSSIDKNLQARIDISFLNFSKDSFGQTLDYTRVPITISARYYFPLDNRLKLFAQAGIETSFDDKDTSYGYYGKQSKSELNVGITPGGGVDFSINPAVSVFVLGDIHLISDNYFSLQMGCAFHF